MKRFTLQNSSTYLFSLECQSNYVLAFQNKTLTIVSKIYCLLYNKHHEQFGTVHCVLTQTAK